MALGSLIDGKCLLVAVDSFILTMTIMNELREHGARVVGLIASCAAIDTSYPECKPSRKRLAWSGWSPIGRAISCTGAVKRA
jgi:hypothetical protein